MVCDPMLFTALEKDGIKTLGIVQVYLVSFTFEKSSVLS
jgi:hypothetical protein